MQLLVKRVNLGRRARASPGSLSGGGGATGQRAQADGRRALRMLRGTTRGAVIDTRLWQWPVMHAGC